MIPKIIHYCWFGRGQMPALAIKCIESWKKYLPDYEIKEWNEDNFNLDMFYKTISVPTEKGERNDTRMADGGLRKIKNGDSEVSRC